jgi:hypothetical protein
VNFDAFVVGQVHEQLHRGIVCFQIRSEDYPKGNPWIKQRMGSNSAV